jgi:zinc transport system substrate-binding protein
MRQKIVLSGFVLCLGLTGLVGCERSPNIAPNETPTTETVDEGEKQGDRLEIVVGILPQQYFAEKIGGDRIHVGVMVAAGSEPEAYEPKPQQFQEISQADAYIGVGGIFEEVWGERLKTANPQLLIVDGSAGITKIPMEEHDHGHDHGGEAAHGDEYLDPHTWLSPKLAKIHAQNIYQTLVKLDPASEAFYAANLATLLTEIDQLDQAIAAKLANLKSRNMLVFHPSWGYFAKDYNLKQIPIEVGGQEPSAAELANLITLAKAENIRMIFAQYQFNAQAAKAIANEIGAEVIYLDPLAADWSTNLLDMATQIAAANQN